MPFYKENFLALLILFLFQVNCWSQQPPSLSAGDEQAYCPLSEISIAPSFNIENPDNVRIDTIYIQISEGYIKNEDFLKLRNTPSHPNITPISFEVVKGRLRLKWNGTGDSNDAEIIAAVKDVVFKNTSSTPSGEREFSITISEKNYLPTTGHYYEYISDEGITWQEAKIKTETSPKYYGVLQGYLATITSKEEAQLSGEQAGGAGWIGGSDADSEGVWRWVTGPEGLENGGLGRQFWQGKGSGSGGRSTIPDNYANWNGTIEPNDYGNNEDYAHIVTDNDEGIPGTWNDLSNTGHQTDINDPYYPRGYIVEYGGMPEEPILNISTNSKIYIPEITSVSPKERCGEGVIELEATASFGEVEWYNDEGDLVYTGNPYPKHFSNTEIFYVQDSKSPCDSGNRTQITATINALPEIESNVTLINCDEDGNPDGFTIFNLKEADLIITKGDSSLDVNYYLTYDEANLDTPPPPINTSPFNSINAIDKKVFARVVETSKDCHKVSTVTLETITTSFPPDFNYEIKECEIENDSSIFDFTDATLFFLSELSTPGLTVHYYKSLTDAQLEENEIIPQNSFTSESIDLFVRVESPNGDCNGIGKHLTLTVLPQPEFEIEAIPANIVCINNPQLITLEIINEQDVGSIKWYDENDIQISPKVTEPGIYTAIATSLDGCESFPQTVEITESDIAFIELDDISITDDSTNNTITIHSESNNLGVGDYEFSLDDSNGPYQDEPFFDNVSPGIHTIFIQDKNQCGTTQIDVSVIGYPKFFTPNGDGQNDSWHIRGVNANFYSSAEIYIFDRFGKLITQINASSNGWNGFYNGKQSPASDYWFTAQLVDENGNIREKKGHFSLIR